MERLRNARVSIRKVDIRLFGISTFRIDTLTKIPMDLEQFLSDPKSSLRALRQLRKMSQRELARLTGLHYNTVYQIESGKRIPKTETSLKLWEALK